MNMDDKIISYLIFETLEDHWKEHKEVDNLGSIWLAYGDCNDNDIRDGLEMFYEKHKDEIGSWETYCKMMHYDLQSLFENMVPMDSTIGAWIIEDGEYIYKEESLLSNFDMWEYNQFLEENGFNTVSSLSYGEEDGLHVQVYKEIDTKTRYLIVLWDPNGAIEYFLTNFPNITKVINDIKFLIDMDKRAD